MRSFGFCPSNREAKLVSDKYFLHGHGRISVGMSGPSGMLLGKLKQIETKTRLFA